MAFSDDEDIVLSLFPCAFSDFPITPVIILKLDVPSGDLRTSFFCP